jgi:hypothetical protein
VKQLVVYTPNGNKEFHFGDAVGAVSEQGDLIVYDESEHRLMARFNRRHWICFMADTARDRGSAVGNASDVLTPQGSTA